MTPSLLHRDTLLALLAMVGVVQSVHSQAPGPDGRPGPRRELRELREQVTLRALASGRMLAEQYASALASLETQAAESADYETALAAQQRQQELAEQYANQDLDPTHTIILKPTEAKTVGAVALDKAENTLTNWRSAGSSASWDVFKITPGTYTVTLTYGVAELGNAPPPVAFGGVGAGGQTGGEIEFGEVTNLTGSDNPKLSLELKSTGGWKNYETSALGELKLTRTSARFAIKATRLRGTGGLMHLKEIRLTPSRPTSGPTDRAATRASNTELEELRAAYQAKIKQLEQPILNQHLARLTTLGDELVAKNDGDGAQAVVAEAKRAQKSLDKADKTSKAPQASAFSEGLDEVHDAQFSEAATNSGDRFLVRIRGEKVPLKLMSVLCPSPNPEDEVVHAFCANYFGITKEDSIAIGRRAQDFTAAYLRDKPLKLLTRWQKDPTGSVLAAVQPDEIGDFAGILVDNGLAAVLEPSSKGSAQRRIEENTHSVLKQREAAARARSVPPGAWFLTPERKPGE